MSVRSQVAILKLVGLGTFLIFMAFFSRSPKAPLLVLAAPLFGIAYMFIRCPRCGRPAGLKETKIGLGRLRSYGPPPDNCPRCNWNFGERYAPRGPNRPILKNTKRGQPQ